MNECPPARKIDHHRPEVNQTLPEGLFRTDAGFGPLQSHSGALGSFIDCLYAYSRQSVRGMELERRILFKTNPQSAVRNRRQPVGKVERHNANR